MRYDSITERPFCCVPAVLQMIQAKRGIRSKSQEEIGWDLGLIVPPEVKSAFTKVRTGPEPRAGYGTQTSNSEEDASGYNKILQRSMKNDSASLERMDKS